MQCKVTAKGLVLEGGLNTVLDSGVGLLWEIKMGPKKSAVR